MRKIGQQNINYNLVLILGAAIGAYFFVLKPILEATGIKSTEEEEETKRKAQDLENKGIWDPMAALMKKYSPGTTYQFLKTVEADKLASNIESAWSFYNDDEEQVYAQFRAIRFQSQVSSIVDAYRRLYNKDLQNTLRSNLSSSEFAVVTNIVASKPSGISK